MGDAVRWSTLAAVAVLAFVTALSVTACGPAVPVASPTPSHAEREVAAACRRDAVGGTPVHFDGVNGARLGGLVLGTGSAGVVLVHQIDADLCQWLPYGRQLAGRGYRVLLVDLGGFGSSEPSSQPDQDVKQAVGFLRQQGVRSIVLIGASLGATSSLSAAVIVRPPVDAVVSLSGPIRTRRRRTDRPLSPCCRPRSHHARSSAGTRRTAPRPGSSRAGPRRA
jgi:pimeloyl-ACP methyl ester carboxylesterase